MDALFRHGTETIRIALPDEAVVYRSQFPEPGAPAGGLVAEAVSAPAGGPPLRAALNGRRPGEVVVVVSDITRPIPYHAVLPPLLSILEDAGVGRDEITVLVATGLHRATTPDEKAAMLGDAVAGGYEVVDHSAEDDAALVELPEPARSGAAVRLNRRYVEAGFRLITGLVEPHFMAGFSGGRKAICPGLAALETVTNFHGAGFLASPLARNANLGGNPLHEEALSVARQAPPDFSVNVVLDSGRRVVRAFAGALEAAHDRAVAFVRSCACPAVEREADVVVTSSGGYPLDATFYQCVKGFVSCLPAVKAGGGVIAFGACLEGVGSPEYADTMQRYAAGWRRFLDDIRRPGVFTKDQWQFQMHGRALARVGQGGLHFVTDGLDGDVLAGLSVTGHAVDRDRVAETVQSVLDDALRRGGTVAVIPEGPYCAPVESAK